MQYERKRETQFTSHASQNNITCSSASLYFEFGTEDFLWVTTEMMEEQYLRKTGLEM